MTKAKKEILQSGLPFITMPQAGSTMATLIFMVGTGSKYESRKQAGISHFLEHMYFKGTAKRPTTLAIAEYLDEVGAEYNAFTGKEYTAYYAKVPTMHLARAFDFLADALLHSKFPAAEIKREKGVVVEEMKMYQDTPMEYVSEIFEELLYPNQPAGRLVLGYEDSVRAMTRKDFLDYQASQYVAGNSVLCLAGGFDRKEASQLANKYFAAFRQGQAQGKEPVQERSQRGPGLLLRTKKTDQTHLCLGWRSFDLLHPARYALEVLSAIAGGSMSSRLFISVRERLGLCYYISSKNELYTDSGYFMVQAGVDSGRVEQAILVVQKEIAKLVKQNIGSKEIKKAKEYLKGKILMAIETSDNLASELAQEYTLTGEIMTIDEIFAKIDQVKASDLRRLAGTIFRPEKINLSVIGPEKNKQKFARLLK